jgi:PAS domain S-box-containing protein
VARRQIAPVVLVLALTVVGFLGARALGERQADRDSGQRADLAAAQIRERLNQAESVTEGLRLLMVGAAGRGMTSAGFATNASRWLAPAGFPAAAWVERVPTAGRDAYERRAGRPIVTQDHQGRSVSVGSRRAYLPSTLVSGIAPMLVPGTDLAREPGMQAALARAGRLYDAAATPLARRGDGTRGIFLVRFAPRLTGGVVKPGFVVVFVSDLALRAAATAAPALRLTVGGSASGAPAREVAVHRAFAATGQRFDVAVPRLRARGAAAMLPWIVAAGGLALSGLAAALGFYAARRARAQGELDRIFTLSPDLITVADFDGRFVRVNPAVEQVLGYTPEEFLARPYMELVHPDDRESTAAEAAEISRGKTTLTFTNRYIGKDGEARVLEWTSAPVVADGLMYGVGRDVTARHRAETDLRRLVDEQAALRRVATLVARGTGPERVFRAVASEAGTLLGCDTAAIVRFEADGTATVLGGHRARRRPGTRFTPDPDYVIATVRATGRAARFDTGDPTADGMPEPVRAEGIRSGLASPIVVDGELWGSITVASLHRSLPAPTEDRLADFTGLVATAVSNAQAREELRGLADEQAALRRVATLVAREASQGEIFHAIAEEIARLLGTRELRMLRYEGDTHAVVVARSGTLDAFHVGDRFALGDEGMAARVFRTGQPARIDYGDEGSGRVAVAARSVGLRSGVGTPIVVDGRLWGVMATATDQDDPLPPEALSRLGQFTELIATAIANAEARAQLARLAEEQAALQRVATLVAEGAAPAAVLDAVAGEMQALLDADQVALNRFEPTDEILVLAHRGLDAARTPVGSRVSIAGDSVTATVRRTGRPARMEGYDEAAGPLAELARATGLRSSVSAPVVVEGRLWGLITASWKSEESPPADTEARVLRFGELVGTAVANTEARAEVERLAAEQGALRRVATLIAEEASLEAVFAKVAEEVTTLLGGADCSLFRDEGDGTASIVAVRGTRLSAGLRLPLDGTGVIATVMRERRPYRTDDTASSSGTIAARGRELGIRSAVGCPIVVRGRLWGAMGAGRYEPDAFPAGTETRIARFAELVATAVGNAETRAEVERLADEQAALRRVATLVARGATPTVVFDAVAAEMARLLQADDVTLSRYEPGAEITVVAHYGPHASRLPAGSRVSYEGDNVTALVQRTESAGRVEHAGGTIGTIADIVRDMGVHISVGAPIVVDGRLWGVISARWREEEDEPPDDTEERMAHFAELLDTAIANADGRDQLMASRARLVTAGDDARRRVVRDLHDGAQQRLVHTVVALKLAQRALRQGDGRAESFVDEALEHAETSNAELRELAHGILPEILTRGGLAAGVNALVARLDLAVRVDIPRERLPADTEASAYFVVAEALTNVVKHAQAERAEVRAAVEDGVLRIDIDDDGIGGADPDGHGLVGMADRVTALGGRLAIESPAAGGTRVTATLPLSPAA